MNSGGNSSLSVARVPAVTRSLDTTFCILSNPRRCYLLCYLLMTDDETIAFDAARNAVFKLEAAGTETDAQLLREEVGIALYHTHLPLLADAEIIEYEPDEERILFTGHPSIEEWVEHTQYREFEYFFSTGEDSGRRPDGVLGRAPVSR